MNYFPILWGYNLAKISSHDNRLSKDCPFSSFSWFQIFFIILCKWWNEVNTMVNEQRKVERRDFTYYMKVTDAGTGSLVGYLVDISTGGLNWIAKNQYPSGRIFAYISSLVGISPTNLRWYFLRAVFGVSRTTLPNTFKIGFQIIGLSTGDAIIFRTRLLPDKYAASRNNNRQNYNSIKGWPKRASLNVNGRLIPSVFLFISAFLCVYNRIVTLPLNQILQGNCTENSQITAGEFGSFGVRRPPL